MWCKMHVLFHSDNDAVVRYARTSKVPSLMRLLHSLRLAAAQHSFSFSAQHVPGVNNQIADALSHFRCQDFRQLVLGAQPHPTWIPPRNFWWLWHLYLRAAMLFRFDPRPCSVYLLFVCFSPSKVYFLLTSAGEVRSFRAPLPSRWRETFPFHHFSC